MCCWATVNPGEVFVCLFFNFYKLEHDLESIRDSHCQDYADSKLVNISANMIHWEASFFPVIKLLSLTTKLWLFWEAEFGHNKNWIVFGPSHLKTRLTKKSFLALLVGVSVRNSVTLSTSTRDKRIKAWKDCRFFFFLWDLNIIIMLGSSEILAGCIEELKYPFVSSHSCYVGKGMLVVFGNGSEGSTGRCATGKSTPHLVRGTKHTCWEKCCLQNPFWYDSKCLR